ncbi:transposase zinc-binding domain-containing protein [Marispirochaeta sp.]|uniref:transposase zinc-binding domain-containing protein n=1 Tax=Marispirochaeta sp. TaxID=2038653 RepID=UPI00374A0E20
MKKPKAKYLPRGRNTLHQVFERHFPDFCSRYDEEYADTFGKFRLERIQAVGEHFLTCGDYRQGIARIRCSNPDCGHDYFRPFSCKGFYLCPSCSQKRTLLFAEHLSEKVLLRLPHRTIRLHLSESPAGILSPRQKAFCGNFKDDIRHDK